MGWFFMTKSDQMLDVFKARYKMLKYSDTSDIDNYDIKTLESEIKNILQLRGGCDEREIYMRLSKQIDHRETIIRLIEIKNKRKRFESEREPNKEDLRIFSLDKIYRNEEAYNSGITNERFVSLLKEECLKCSKIVCNTKIEINKLSEPFFGENLPQSVKANIDGLTKKIIAFEGWFEEMKILINKYQ
ncbi:hypothetical protein KY334_05245 [Candidatus Woesearchaeota archaeon]|nr:hypothetical protein [Candidatus Woesearchaeota archaeon]